MTAWRERACERASERRRPLLQITYPDEWHDYQQPQPAELVQVSERLHRLRMTLLLSADLWAEASDVRVRCGLLTTDGRGGDAKTRRAASAAAAADAAAPLPFSAAYAESVTTIVNSGGGGGAASRAAAAAAAAAAAGGGASATAALAFARRRPAPVFVPLREAARPSQPNLVTFRIHPMARC